MEIIFPVVLEEEEIVEFLNSEVGDVPKSLTMVAPTKCRVTFESKKAAQKAVGLKERRLEGGKKIRATIFESRATLWDAISFITEKLEAEERKAMKMRNPHTKENQEYRRQRG